MIEYDGQNVLIISAELADDSAFDVHGLALRRGADAVAVVRPVADYQRPGIRKVHADTAEQH